MTRTARILVVGKATVSRWYQQEGIDINPLRNGVALKGTGERFRPRDHSAGIARMVRGMQKRAKRCLSKRLPSATLGMTDAEAFRWNYHNRPEKRLYELLRRRMKKVLKEGVKHGRSLDLVGCSTLQLRAHIEAQFTARMNWSNQGTGKNKWHIDHHIPCAAFDLTGAQQQRICFHFTNLRPMWSLENIAKGARMDQDLTLPLPMDYRGPKPVTPCALVHTTTLYGR